MRSISGTSCGSTCSVGGKPRIRESGGGGAGQRFLKRWYSRLYALSERRWTSRRRGIAGKRCSALSPSPERKQGAPGSPAEAASSDEPFFARAVGIQYTSRGDRSALAEASQNSSRSSSLLRSVRTPR